MPAAIRPYSMAVAPLSSLRKRLIRLFMGAFLGLEVYKERSVPRVNIKVEI
jgi:hypothetical protein